MFERCDNEDMREVQNRVSNLKVEDFISLLRTHPLFMLLEHGVHLEGMKRPLFLEMNYYGLSQHYNFSSGLVDFTSDITAAAFFATTENKGNDVYLPYGGTPNNRVGVVYVYGIVPKLTFTFHNFRSIGQQLYPRTGAQKGFFYQKDMAPMPLEKLVKPFYFRHDIDCARQVFEMQKNGERLFPKDQISEYAHQILTSNTISGITFSYNLYTNCDDLQNNLDMLAKMGISVDWHKRYLFTPDMLKDYYAEVRNGLWEQFCKPIVFWQRDGDKLKEQLLKLPNNLCYRQYFEQRYWEQLYWGDNEDCIRAKRNEKIKNRRRANL